MLILRKPWTRQPQTVVGVNWAHQRANGLCFFSPLGDAFGFRDLITQQWFTKVGLGTGVVTPEGQTKLFGTSNYCTFTPPAQIGPTTPLTIAWTQLHTVSTSASVVAQINFGTGGTHRPLLIYESATGASAFLAGPQVFAGAHNWASSVGVPVNGQIDRFVLVAAGGSQSITGSDWTLYRNGALMARGTTTNFADSALAGARLGVRESAPTDPFDGALLDVRIWARPLTPSEAADESIRIKAAELYQPRRIIIPVSAGAGGGDVTLALTGQASASAAGTLATTVSTEINGATVTASAGTVALTASVALSGSEVTASAGAVAASTTLDLTGQAVTAAAGNVTTGSDVTAALSGSAANADAGIVAPALSVALTGSAVTASAGTVAQSCTVTLSGQAVTAAAGTVVASTDGSITLAVTGEQIVVSAGTVSQSRTVALSGQAVVVSAGTISYDDGTSTTIPTMPPYITVYMWKRTA